MFLQNLAFQGSDAATAGGAFAALAGLIIAFMIVFIIIAILGYIYMSFAFMAIAKKAKYPTPGIAWIPWVGPLIITSSTAKMHWWPILLIIGCFIPVVGPLFGLALGVFSIIWFWKTCEAINYPGWYALLMLIPIVNIVMLGVIAWSKK